MEEVGGQEILMPVLQPKENWLKTGRWQSLEVLFKTSSGDEKEYALGPTHEEVVSPLVKKIIFSYRDLPFSVFQIQTKFRDELRPKSGILRTREFLMKDLYSFHANQKDLDDYYEKVAKSYLNIFKECGIDKMTYRTLAGGGSFSKYSDEFQTITEAGEDIIYICKKCKIAINKEIYPIKSSEDGVPPKAGQFDRVKPENQKCLNCKGVDFDEKKAVEVGNIFKLGTNFSKPFDLKFTDRDGYDKFVLMGSYGIGLSRLMGAIVENSHDDKGIIWPKSVAPFLVHIIEIIPETGSPTKKEKARVRKESEKIYNILQKNNIDVLCDDRENKSAGEKFAEADLIGIPFRVVVSEKTLAKNSVEVKERVKNKVQLVKISQIVRYFKKI